MHDMQSDDAWERVKHLPVNRHGYKHSDNRANYAYRRKEEAAWQAAYEGKSKRLIDFAWRVSSSLKMEAALHRMELRLVNKVFDT